MAGYRPGLLGASFYPTAGALLGPGNRYDWLRSTATALTRRFRRPLFIAEGAYPSGVLHGGFPYNTPVPGYPLTVEGQRRFVGELVAWGVRSGHLAGYRPWAPDYCTPSGGWAPMSLFVASGATAHAKPALSALPATLARRRER